MSIEIHVMNHGPIRVMGKGIVLKDATGVVHDLGGREAIALCRCGASENKPFCDGTHKKTGFQSEFCARAAAQGM